MLNTHYPELLNAPRQSWRIKVCTHNTHTHTLESQSFYSLVIGCLYSICKSLVRFPFLLKNLRGPHSHFSIVLLCNSVWQVTGCASTLACALHSCFLPGAGITSMYHHRQHKAFLFIQIFQNREFQPFYLTGDIEDISWNFDHKQ